MEVDEWVIGGGSIELNLNTPMGYVNATEVRSSYFDLAERNTVDGVRTHVSRASEKGIRMKMPIANTTGASVMDSRVSHAQQIVWRVESRLQFAYNPPSYLRKRVGIVISKISSSRLGHESLEYGLAACHSLRRVIIV